MTRSDTAEAPTVTVIGSGPAGLSSAAQLQRRGARVTVLEKASRWRRCGHRATTVCA